MVAERLAARERNEHERNEKRMDVLEYLIEARPEQEGLEPIAKVLMTVLFAGHANTVRHACVSPLKIQLLCSTLFCSRNRSSVLVKCTIFAALCPWKEFIDTIAMNRF